MATLQIKEFATGDLILGVAEDIGPRILKLALKSMPDENLFGILPEAGVETPDGFWRIYGGHRLWISPEAMPRSYSMDDAPVRIEEKEGVVKIYGNTEMQYNIQKEIEIRTAGARVVEVLHRIKNTGRWPVTLACWALTVMKTGGFAIIPVKAGGEGILPDRRLSLWPYTDLSDERLVMEKDFIFLKQDVKSKSPIKIGAMAYPSWTAYWVDGLLFVKQFVVERGDYPDFGCDVEAYTNPGMLELETVGPLKNLEPGSAAEHREIWSVKKVSSLSPSQKDVEEKIIKKGVI
ncbi:MAG: hypothetical protein JW957_02125 [Candidatus Omnitrophica bacterium]|nr:hypothetical protein [Candidatus Omnitrophota bacterium]